MEPRLIMDIHNSGVLSPLALHTRRCGHDFKSVMTEHMMRIKFHSASCEIALRWIPFEASLDHNELTG